MLVHLSSSILVMSHRSEGVCVNSLVTVDTVNVSVFFFSADVLTHACMVVCQSYLLCVL